MSVPIVEMKLDEYKRREDELDALRARVAQLEEVIQTQNGVVVSGTLKLNEARARVAQLEAELETERMRLDACGVVANANTASSAEEQRKMHPNYWSASCGDVAKAVDREMALRVRAAQLEATLNIFVAATEAANLRVAKLETALTKIADNDPDGWEAAIARAALQDAPQ